VLFDATMSSLLDWLAFASVVDSAFASKKPVVTKEVNDREHTHCVALGWNFLAGFLATGGSGTESGGQRVYMLLSIIR